MRVIFEVYKIDVISTTSLNRFIVGGAAILHAINMNHHMDIIGIMDIMPFIKYILRVL